MCGRFRWILLFALATGVCTGQEPVTPRGAASHVALAYAAKQAHDLERAAALFAQALAEDPANLPLRKDFAYTLLAIGKSGEARDEFAIVFERDPKDSHAGLEYAFLCHETGKQEDAWRLFRDLREAENPEHRATAIKTFANMEADLLARIERLEEALRRDPGNYSSHLELARARRIRNDFAPAAAEFEAAYRLKPEYPEVLIEMAAALREAGDEERAAAVTLTASRSASAFVAEQAKALLPHRHPYLAEFEAALRFQPGQSALRREMAFFLLSLGRGEEARAAFSEVLQDDPHDWLAAAQFGFLEMEQGRTGEARARLQAALATRDPELRRRIEEALARLGAVPPPSQNSSGSAAASEIPSGALGQDLADAEAAREMGRKSYEAGFIPDAIRFYREAQRLDPANFDTMLRLAWSLNMAKRDDEALRWFSLAARSPDAAVAREARTAIRNLAAPAPSPSGMAATASHEGPVASLWVMPLHSTRWGSTFSYAQAKLEWLTPRLPVVPYASLRFAGDTTGAVGVTDPQFLSENSFILGLGARTRAWNGVLAWGEAGSSMAYRRSQGRETGRFLPDYRGGLSQFRLFGPSLLAMRPGAFAETINDLVYIHRFDRDTLAISRNRLGWNLGRVSALGGLQFQTFLNLNLNADFKGQAWANFVEAGPGARLRWAWMPPPVSFTFSYLRGHHMIRRMDGRPNTYNDFQAGFWYAFSH